MDYAEKERLALTGNGDAKASSIRAKAARLYTGNSQEDVGANAGVKKAAINNVEKARSLPSRSLMMYFFREHRIDFNFLIYGQFSQLPSDVQDRLFEKLQDVHNELDQTTN
ncbi:helix-turn-helix domain-containing protein [Halocynthiibacter sp.]|uniref:helix-turn-helix domain-containing protein n=1 Tax=Halocynthiibacter sp. TaxID=1979210 RepID=UPI003C6AAE36